MQATYRVQRPSGVLSALMVFLAALILGGAGGYVLKSATAISVRTTTVKSVPASVSAPSSTQVTTDTSGEARRHFKLAN
ncbi:MAG: hypothetical protein M3Z28_04645 [Candidatus Dormibacteraeota bacterium]|nr:hypothetical protein [Candidatus Dormibacteraeota bacterium]